MKPQTLPLTAIRCDSGTQCRSGVNEDAVAEYADRMTHGDSFPPVVVFFDGSEHHMADGFHRYLAASRNGSESLLADVRTGTATDALWHGLGSNRANGVRLSPGDKRRAVELALDRFPAKSQQEIADHVGCAQSYVAAVKRDVLVITGDNVTTRKDTKGRNQPTAKPRKPKPDAEPQTAANSAHQSPNSELRTPVSDDPESRAYRVSLKLQALADTVKESIGTLNPTRAELVQAACTFRKLANELDRAASQLPEHLE